MSENTTHWFKHDYNARRDPKLIRLSRVKGTKGIGIYWSLIEIMHEQEGSIGRDEISDIAFELREDENNVLSILNEFDLFVIQERYYSNTRVLQSLDGRKGKSSTAKANVEKRWAKTRQGQLPEKEASNTGVLPKTYDSNTIREDKSREDKNTPSLEIFLKYAQERLKERFPALKIAVEFKYHAWVENNWSVQRKGKNYPILNWKTTLNNTFQHLKPVYTESTGQIAEY